MKKIGWVVLLILGVCWFLTAQQSILHSPSPFVKSNYAEYDTDMNGAREIAEKTIDKLKNQYPTPDEDLTFGYWQLQHVFEEGEITSHWQDEGHWVKFYKDFTYQIGVNNEIVTLGSYFFLPSEKYLVMLDAQNDQQPKAWRMALEGTDATMIGRDIAGVTNGLQIKLVGVYHQPGKATGE